MSTITISDELYRSAERSAKLSNISLNNFVERAISWAVSRTATGPKRRYKLKPVDQLHPVVRDLIGIAKEPDGEHTVDADEARMAYLKEKYGL